MTEWLKSDVFIIFVVVVVLAILVLVALYFTLRRHRIQTTAEELAQMELAFPDDHLPGLDTNNEPKFLMKIITEQKHVSEIVQMTKDRTHSIDLGVVSSSLQAPLGPWFSMDTKTDDSSLDEGSSSSSNMPIATRPRLSLTGKFQSAKVHPFKTESGISSESDEYFSS